jgi:hypothetical protein
VKGGILVNEAYFPAVVQAVPGPNRTVYAYFSDGSIKQFDVKPLIAGGGVFARLAEDDFFENRLTVLNDTVAWDLSGHYDPTDCIDIDPFTVYQAQSVPDPLEDAG